MEQEKDEKVVRFLDDVDPENVTREIWGSLNSIYSHVSHLVNYKYYLVLYRLVKLLGEKKLLTMDDLIEATKCSRARLYKIASDFERREIERIHAKDS